MDITPNLSLPYILAAQAQKHVTHNDGLRILDALSQIMVFDRDLATPPASPSDGARYLVAASPTGTWAGQAGKIAAWQDGAWMFYTPKEGWLVWVADEDLLLAYNGAAFVAPPLQNVAMLGINTTADATNRLALSSAAALFNHAGAGHQVKVNKAAPTDSASFLFQTGFSGRAEIGTTGDDDFHFKVSPDGVTWREALKFDKASGAMTTGVASGPVLTHDTAASPTSGGYDWRLLYNGGGQLSNGPAGQENYINDVWALGINVGSQVGVRADTAKQYLALEFESKYYQSGTFASEFHLGAVDTAGVTHRPLSFFLPHDGGAGSSSSYTVDVISFHNYAGTQKVKWDFPNNVVNLMGGLTLRGETNNDPVFQQLNAAGNAYLDLPYIDADNKLAIAQTAKVAGSVLVTGAFEEADGHTVLLTGGSTNTVGLKVQRPNASAAVIMMECGTAAPSRASSRSTAAATSCSGRPRPAAPCSSTSTRPPIGATRPPATRSGSCSTPTRPPSTCRRRRRAILWPGCRPRARWAPGPSLTSRMRAAAPCSPSPTAPTGGASPTARS